MTRPNYQGAGHSQPRANKPRSLYHIGNGNSQRPVSKVRAPRTRSAQPRVTSLIAAAIIEPPRAGVAQLAEHLLPKQRVAGSNPVPRSTFTDSLASIGVREPTGLP